MPFISFCCLIAEARTTLNNNTMPNNSGESGHPCLVSDCRGKALFFFPLEDDISCGSFTHGLYDVVECSIYTYFVEGFFERNGCCILSPVFFTSIERIVWFLTFLLLL